MSWEKRGKFKHRYYIKSVRIGGRTTKQYVGRAADPAVQVFAKAEELRRAERSSEVEEVRSEQTDFKQLQITLVTLAKRVRQEVRNHLHARGFRRQKGKWQVMKEPKQSQRSAAEETGEGKPTRELLEHLARLADRGDLDAADQLRQIIQRYDEVWRPIGDLTAHAEAALITLIGSRSLILRESVRMRADDLRTSLKKNATDDATDCLLVDHVVVLWLEVEFARMAANQPAQFKRDTRFWEQRYERAHGRYLAAIRELTAIRQLLGPSIGDDDNE